MSSKAKVKPKSTRKASRSTLPIEDDERHQDEVDGFISRNRDSLNESIRRSRKEIDQGIFSNRSIDELIADARRRNKPRTYHLPASSSGLIETRT